MNNLKIIFMGTPEFAVPSLEILVENDFQIKAVVTAVDKPKGRGQKVALSPVKEAALNHGIPVLQPSNLKSPEFLQELKSHKANLQVVVAFRMLPEVVWGSPELGTFNLHASLLPQYRGAAPINWAIMNGETETGLTTFFLRHEIDTGKIIFQEKEPILPEDDAGSLYERLKIKGAKVVLRTAEAVASGDYPQVDQAETTELKKAPKIFKDTCEIDWDQPTKNLFDFIRGLSPYPGAWFNFSGKTCKVFKTEPVQENLGLVNPGEYETDNKDFLVFKTQDGFLSILELQLEGKKRMGIKDLLRGYQL